MPRRSALHEPRTAAKLRLGSIQGAAHHAGQISLAEGLLEELDTLIQASMVNDGVFGVAGHVKHGQARIIAAKPTVMAV